MPTYLGSGELSAPKNPKPNPNLVRRAELPTLVANTWYNDSLAEQGHFLSHDGWSKPAEDTRSAKKSRYERYFVGDIEPEADIINRTRHDGALDPYPHPSSNRLEGTSVN